MGLLALCSAGLFDFAALGLAGPSWANAWVLMLSWGGEWLWGLSGGGLELARALVGVGAKPLEAWHYSKGWSRLGLLELSWS